MPSLVRSAAALVEPFSRPIASPEKKGPGGEPNARALQRDPAKRSSYAALSPSPSRSFGHGLEGLRGFPVADAGQSDQGGSGKRDLLDRGLRILLEVAQQPAGCDARMTP